MKRVDVAAIALAIAAKETAGRRALVSPTSAPKMREELAILRAMHRLGATYPEMQKAAAEMEKK